MQYLIGAVAIPAFVLACGVALYANAWLAVNGFYPL